MRLTHPGGRSGLHNNRVLQYDGIVLSLSQSFGLRFRIIYVYEIFSEGESPIQYHIHKIISEREFGSLFRMTLLLLATRASRAQSLSQWRRQTPAFGVTNECICFIPLALGSSCDSFGGGELGIGGGELRFELANKLGLLH